MAKQSPPRAKVVGQLVVSIVQGPDGKTAVVVAPGAIQGPLMNEHHYLIGVMTKALRFVEGLDAQPDDPASGVQETTEEQLNQVLRNGKASC